MRFSLLASEYPEYRALRPKSRSLALVWQLGHACSALSVLTALCAAEVLVVNLMHSELTTERDRSFVGTFIGITVFFIGIGLALRKYAIRKGEGIDVHH